MSYRALYRVWRPKQFSDVAGQSHITRTLQNAILQNKFSHAYLFSGPRGTGKTSAAKIFAKAVNCENTPAKEPCNACSACLGIEDGSISDVIEIDAASNNGVEQIRDIRDKVKYAPTAVTYKVYIIDEVHMLSIGAFNALLKTLEEPPKHVLFVLATTEPHKIPLTIISRCQRFDFKRITQIALQERMREIVTAEKISITDEALHLIALSAEGGMRDALSLLDQAISYSEEKVELADVLAVTGAVSHQKLAQITEAMYANNVKEALQQIDQLIQAGKDPGRFVYDLICYLRDLLLYQSDKSLEEMLERAVVNDTFNHLAEQINAFWIQQAIAELNQCQQEMKWTTSPKVFIEIAVLTISDQKRTNVHDDSDTVKQLVQKIEKMEKQLAQLKEQPVAVQDNYSPDATPKRAPQRSMKNSYRVPYDQIRQVLAEASKPELKHVQTNWAKFMDVLKKQNAPAHATIQDSKPSAASEKALVIAFRYEIHCSLAIDHRQTIESLLADIIGKELRIIPIPESNWKSLREEYVQKQKEQEEIDSPTQQQEENPLIEEAKKRFGDDLIEIHE